MRTQTRERSKDHLAEINDVTVPDLVDLFKAQIELFVLKLLDAGNTTAIDQITRARKRAAEHIINLARDGPPTSEDTRATRIAASM